MSVSEIATIGVALIGGLGSGVIGSFVGARNERRLFDKQADQARFKALWAYEMALRDEGEYLTDQGTSGGSGRHRKAGPTVAEARVEAYQHLSTLPADLEADLRNPFPYVHTSYEAGDHMGWLANRLRDALKKARPPGRGLAKS